MPDVVAHSAHRGRQAHVLAAALKGYLGSPIREGSGQP